MKIRTIEWQNNKIKIIDQTKLPLKLEYTYIKDVKSLRKAIKEMKIRGAPALGAAAGLGVYLGIRGSKAKTYPKFKGELDKIVANLLRVGLLLEISSGH
jgi:methylthioribose-1-phosphate isomerase